MGAEQSTAHVPSAPVPAPAPAPTPAPTPAPAPVASAVPAVSDATAANTRANRSPTNVARHVALNRLAMRLADMEEMGFNAGEDAAALLGIPEEVRAAVRRYSPSASFGSIQEDDVGQEEDVVPIDVKVEAGIEVKVQNVDATNVDAALTGTPHAHAAQVDPTVAFSVKRKRDRVVSFAKHAELRLFRPDVVPWGRVAVREVRNEPESLRSVRARSDVHVDGFRSKRCASFMACS